RVTAPSLFWLNQMPPEVRATPTGSPPTRIVLTTRPDDASRLEIVPAPRLATQSERERAAIPYGLRATRILATTLFVDGSMRATVPSSLFVTQTEPAANATA